MDRCKKLFHAVNVQWQSDGDECNSITQLFRTSIATYIDRHDNAEIAPFYPTPSQFHIVLNSRSNDAQGNIVHRCSEGVLDGLDLRQGYFGPTEILFSPANDIERQGLSCRGKFRHKLREFIERRNGACLDASCRRRLVWLAIVSPEIQHSLYQVT